VEVNLRVVVSDRAARDGEGGGLEPKVQKTRKPSHNGLILGWMWPVCSHLGSCEVTGTPLHDILGGGTWE
jgi:hypothetical protein